MAVRDPEWKPKPAEDVVASRLMELEEFLETLRTTEPTGTRILDLLPGLLVGQTAGAPIVYRVTAPRDEGVGRFFTISTRVFTRLAEAAEDARKALDSYPDYVRSTIKDLLCAGFDLHGLADQALAESVMDE